MNVNRKINVLLDLDNTIINSLDPDELKFINPAFVDFNSPPIQFEENFKFANMEAVNKE